jgi:hypothetical protein
MRPLDAFINVLHRLVTHNFDRKRPGHAIEKASPAEREALKELTSDDLNRLRVEKGINL